jgi:L-methionine (R)-S-oxide reductase
MSDMADFDLIVSQAQSLASADAGAVALMSNLSALLMQSMDRISWAGFYILRNGELVLGPFQGKPACIQIPVGRGVCRTSIAQDAPQVVPDVTRFPGHIACDSASRSEIVIPIHRKTKEGGTAPAGVLDIDSPVPDRFHEDDLSGLTRLVRMIESAVDITGF